MAPAANGWACRVDLALTIRARALVRSVSLRAVRPSALECEHAGMESGRLHPVRWYRQGDDHADKGVPGTYRVDDQGRVEAHLHSTFDGEASPLFGMDPDFPSMLHGEVLREAVTLVGCRITGQRGGLSDQCDAVVSADYALEGFGFLDEDELEFTEVRLRFTDQDVWTGWDRFAVAAGDRRRLTEMGAVLRDVPEVEARVDRGVLKLVDGSYVNQEHDAHRWVLQSRSYFEFRFDRPLPIREVFDRYAYPLQVMLLSASGRLPGVAAMAGTNSEWDFGKGSEQLPSRWFEVRRFHGPLETPRASDLAYLHRLSDLEFGIHMPALLDAVDKHRFALGHYGLLHADRFVGGNPARFGVATQLIDAFDRTLHPQDRGDPAFEARLKRLEDESGNLIDGIVGNRKWRGEVAALRNFVVHGDVHAHEVLRDQRPLVAGTEALLLLFEVRFLVEFGVQPDRAKALATGRVHHWTIEKAITDNYPSLTALVQQERHRHRGRRGRRRQ